ncbi:MAG: hypothetical protein WBP54_09125 [Pelodictyon phaeoclathratiforme]
MERLAGAVERFDCASGGRIEGSKCRAVVGTAFAGGWAGRLCLGVGQAAQTERSGEQRLWSCVCRIGYEQRRKESQHGCSSATCGEWEPLRVWVVAGWSGRLRKRSEAESSAYEVFFR